VNLFSSRARVAIADTDDGTICSDNAALREMVMDGYSDVPVSSRTRLSNAIKNQDAFTVLSVFWGIFQVDVARPDVSSRLAVNPFSDCSSHVYAPATQAQGSTTLDSLDMSSIARQHVKGEVTGYFDDVTLYWDKGLTAQDYAHIVNLVAPGSTLTFVRPSWEAHAFWLGWCGIDASYRAFTEEVEKSFTLRSVSHEDDGDVDVSILGIESK